MKIHNTKNWSEFCSASIGCIQQHKALCHKCSTQWGK